MIQKFEGPRDSSVHVWLAPLEASPGVIRALRNLLSPDETFAADRIQISDVRNASVISRGVLRVLLSRYLETTPGELRFRKGSKGKPTLSPSQPLQFNLSHSGKRAVLAFVIGCEIGIDIEHIRSFPDMEAIAARFFCPGEVKDLSRLPPQLREQAFFRCWTRKEAYLKAVGDGLSAPLDKFQVTLCPEEPARFLRLSKGSVPWSLYNIEAGTGYASALAHQGPQRPLQITAINDFSSFLEDSRTALCK